MVLETFIRRAMEKYLSEILEGVDHQAVSLQLMKGEVTLDNVQIKPEFLKSLALPFPFPLAFHRAVVGHLLLAVNWHRIMSEPLLIKLDKIHLWAEAKAYDALIGVDSAYVIHALSKALQDKIGRLSREEDIRLAIEEYGEGEAPKQPSAIIARLIALITTSLQLEITDIHVCISVPGVDEHPGLHMGLVVEQVKFETTDADWKIVPISLLTGPTYKSITVRNICLYLNPDPRADTLAKDKQNNNESVTTEELKSMPVLPPESLPSPEIASAADVAQSIHGKHESNDGESAAKYAFILKPTSLGINMTFNKNLIPTVEVHAIADLAALQLTVTRQQLLTILHLKEVVTARTEQVEKWIEKQPAHPPLANEQQQRYMTLYKRTLNALWLPELSNEEMNEKENMEREFPYEELSLMRHATTLELKKELGNKEKISGRSEAIAKRTYWWDKLFRSEESVKASIESGTARKNTLSQEQKQNILHQVREEGTVPEEAVQEEDSFSMDDLMAMLTFHLSAEINIGEIGLELWHERSEKTVATQAGPARENGLHAEQNIIAVAAREARQRDDKAVQEGVKPESGRSQGLATGAEDKHYEGECLTESHLRPFLRLQINSVRMAAELEQEGDAKVDAEIETIQLFDLSQCNAKDPWTAAHHPVSELVEFGYIGPVVPHTAVETQHLTYSVERDPAPNPTSSSHSVAPPFVPMGVVLRMRRSSDLLDSEQRAARALQKQQQLETGKRNQRVTDIPFGSDPDEDKASAQPAAASGDKTDSYGLRDMAKSKIKCLSASHAVMFAPSIPVRCVSDLLINNVRFSFTDSLVEIMDFIRSPPSPYGDKEKRKMEKGEDVTLIESAQQSSDREEQRTGGEHKKTKQAIALMQNPQQRQQHRDECVDQITKEPVKGELIENPEGEAEKDRVKTNKQRVEAEKKAIEGSVKVVQKTDPDTDAGQGQTPEQAQAPSTAATTTTATSTTAGTAHQSELADIVAKPCNSLSFLSWFSPMMVRLHVAQPFISVISDTQAKQLHRLTFSLNANARALLDGEKDSIHARAELSNIRAWIAKTTPVQAISVASFLPPARDDQYLLHPCQITATFERFPSPFQSSSTPQERTQTSNIDQECRKGAGENVSFGDEDLNASDLEQVFRSKEGVYHMDAEVDISAIHLKLASKVWYMLQPLITRIKQHQQDTTVAAK